uniref:Uncharacterized protein n=1 Tax=Peronospora matthiolae TaxID=2874970 RepID=A0AAV1U5S6_9STRA
MPVQVPDATSAPAKSFNDASATLADFSVFASALTDPVDGICQHLCNLQSSMPVQAPVSGIAKDKYS